VARVPFDEVPGLGGCIVVSAGWGLRDRGVRAMVIHHQDMRRPLGMRRAVPEERLRAALDVILTPRGSTNLGSFERGSGLRLQATDIDWSWGDGPEVLGPAESILMAVAGRRGTLADLSGPGLPILASRIQAPAQDET